MTVLPSSEELHAEAKHLRLAQEAGEIGTWEWDLVSGRMMWSARMFRNLGLEPGPSGDLYPVLVAALHPEDRADAEAALARFRSKAGAVRIEPRIVWPSGETRWLVFLGRTIADAHDEAVLALSELREFIRGLHPAVLNDRGLNAALSGLAARAPLPVTHVHLSGPSGV